MLSTDGLNLIDSLRKGHSFVISRPNALTKRIALVGCL